MSDFVALVLPYRKELLAYAMRLCRSKPAAEDIVQESLLKAMEAWNRFEGADNTNAIRAWLYTITHNYFVTTWRRAQKSAQLRDELRVVAEETTACGARTRVVGFAADLDGYSMEVEEALLCLDHDQRTVVILATRGTSYKEIAAELGLPIGTVMSRLCRARRQLELHLAGYAAAEYGLRRAREDADAVEPAKSPETQSSSVDGVVGGLADLQLRHG